MKHLLAIFVYLVYVAAMQVAHAQPALESAQHIAQSSRPRPTITNGPDYVEISSTRIEVYSPLVFRRKANPDARRILSTRFQVRVFTLPDDDTRTPVDLSLPGDDCESYATLVRQLLPGTDDTISYGPIGVHYLEPTRSETTIRNGYYLFVFERIENVKEDTNDMFRIKRSDSRAYFATGFKMTVHNDGLKANLEDVKAAYAARLSMQDSLRKELTSAGKLPCYTYQRAASDEPEGQVARLDATACEAPGES